MFGFLKRTDIHAGVEQCRSTPGAVLLDVRTPEEYADGHIPGSVNIPLNNLGDVSQVARQDTPLFVYCRSGARSASATAALEQDGYSSVTNIGGIASWRGPVEKGSWEA